MNVADAHVQDPASQTAFHDAIQASALVCLFLGCCGDKLHHFLQECMVFNMLAVSCTGNSSTRPRRCKPAQWNHLRTESGEDLVLFHAFQLKAALPEHYDVSFCRGGAAEL